MVEDQDEGDYESDGPYDASDQKQVNAARKKAARIRQKRLNFLKGIMNSSEGRLWMYEILESCYIFGNPFVPGVPESTAFNLGKADIGKRFLNDINEAAPEKYMTMIAEGKAEK